MASTSIDERLARFLGWFSLVLGSAQVAIPDRVNRLAGIRDDATSRLWQRVVGVRELVAFAAIMATRRRAPGPLWARFAGDAKDMALLALAWRDRRESAPRLAAATVSVAKVAALDLYAALRLGRTPREPTQEETMKVKAGITVRKPREEVYRFWRDFENLPSFMAHVEAVEAVDGRTHWTVKAPAGAKVEWDAELVEDRPGELIAWRTAEGASVGSSGTVRFLDAPRNQGTEVHVDLDYEAPGGRVGATVARLFGEEPAQQARDDLRRFKQVMETGFVVRSEASPAGLTAHRQIKQRPGQPAAEGSES